MAQIFQTLDDLENYFADLFTALTGLPEDMVLIQYEPEGQPTVGKMVDALYVEVSPVQDDKVNFKNRHRAYNSETEGYTTTQQATRTLSVNLIFYGPKCSELAALVNEKIYFQEQKHSLDLNHLSLIPSMTDGPRRVHEEYSGQWWYRCDLTLYFYNTIQVEEEVGTFKEYDIRTEVD